MSKKKPVSFSMDAEMHEAISIAAKKEDMSISELIRNLVVKHMDLIVNDGEEIPIILRVPVRLRGDNDGLRAWLSAKVDAIVGALGAKEN